MKSCAFWSRSDELLLPSGLKDFGGEERCVVVGVGGDVGVVAAIVVVVVVVVVVIVFVGAGRLLEARLKVPGNFGALGDLILAFTDFLFLDLGYLDFSVFRFTISSRLASSVLTPEVSDSL